MDGAAVAAPDIRLMTGAMPHRGPDDSGTWTDDCVGLGHRRLSILDLSANGHQPMTAGAGTAAISYNGEIYNYRELRADLVARGWTFTSGSDTEVILKAYLEFGSEFIAKLDGIFAFAIWDMRKRQLLLARDRLGIKPLYLYNDGKTFLFASEAKAMFSIRPDLAECDSDKLLEHLTFRDISENKTLWRDINVLPPGTTAVLNLKDKQLKIRQYWHLQIPSSQGRVGFNLEELDHLLDATVKSQLVSDVPVGTLCSGGVDSSLVTAYASRHVPAGLHTFSVGFPGTECDEAVYSAAVAKHLGTKHHTLDANAELFAENLARLTWFNDEPLSHPNSVFMNLICGLAKQNGITVLLTGEGADELFCGYRRTIRGFHVQRMRIWDRGLPTSSIWRDLGGLEAAALSSRIMAALTLSKTDLAIYGLAYGRPYLAKQLLGQVGDSCGSGRMALAAIAAQVPPTEAGRVVDLLGCLPSILLRQDKMSMAAAIESRVPMLANAVIDAALRIPAEALIKGTRGKLPLLELAGKLLPPSISERRKMGFALPLSQWFRTDPTLRGKLEALTQSGSLASSYIDTKVVKQLVTSHLSGRGEHTEMLWILLALEVWLGVMKDWRTKVPQLAAVG